MDAADVIRKYRPLIRHVHFKDMDAGSIAWSAMGEGDIDHPGILKELRETG